MLYGNDTCTVFAKCWVFRLGQFLKHQNEGGHEACQILSYDTQMDVNWQYTYIGVIQAKPSKTSDGKAASSSALWSFSACAGTEHLLVRPCFLGVGLDVGVLIGRLRVVAESSQICCQG